MLKIKRTKPVRALIVALALVVAFASPLAEQAHAVVVEAIAVGGAISLIVTVLVAGGMIFATQDDAIAAGTNIWDTYIQPDPKASGELLALAAAATSLFTGDKQGAIRISQALWDSIWGNHAAVIPVVDGTYVIGSFDGRVIERDEKYQYYGNQPAIKDADGNLWVFRLGDDAALSTDGRYKRSMYVWRNGSLYDTFVDNTVSESAAFDPLPYFGFYHPADGASITIGFARSPGVNGQVGQKTYTYVGMSWPITLMSESSAVSYQSTVAYPGGDVMVKTPDMPTTKDEDGKVIFPPIPLTPEGVRVGQGDLPETMGDTQIADIPYDSVVDLTDGTVIDTPVDPTVPVVGLPTAPGFIDGLTLPADTWTRKFPFSVPFDIYRLIGQLKVAPIEPVIAVPYKYGNVVDEEMRLDLSKFSGLFTAIRWLIYVVFLIGLAHATRSFIKW